MGASDIRAGGAYVEASLDTKKLKQGLDQSKVSIDQFSQYMTGVVTKLGVAFAGMFAAQKVFSFVTDSIAAAGEQEKAEMMLTAAIERTNGAIGRTAEEMKALASARQEVTLFGDEATMAAMTVLSKFEELQGTNFDAAIIASQDLATVLGTDLSGAAQKLGQALNNPEMAMRLLREAGVRLTEAEKQMMTSMVETGNAAAAQEFILSKLNGTIGGASEKAAAGYSGKLKQMQNVFGDLMETVGGLVLGPLTDFMEWLKNALKRLDLFIQKMRDVASAVTAAFDNDFFRTLSEYNPFAGVIQGIKDLGKPLPKSEQKKPELRTDFSEFAGGAAGGADGLIDIDKLNESFTTKFGQALVGGLNTFAGAAMGTFSARGAGQIGIDPQKQQVDLLKNIRDIMGEQNKLIAGLELGGLAV